MEWTNALGRRKASIARVYMTKGKGNFIINKKDYTEYIPVVHIRNSMLEPLEALDMTKSVDIKVNVKGGGIKGQAEAIKLGIARALVKMDPENKPKLKPHAYLTRDPRVVERKKPGLKKARKSEQYSKR